MRSRHYAVLLVALLSFTASASAENKSVSAQGQSAPLNTTGPTISGVPVVGNTLQADTGKWNGPSAKYDYQWARCASNGASCSSIGSASEQAYRATNTDVGSTLRVVVTAINKNGAAVSTSDPTPAVIAPTPTTTSSTTSTSASTTTTTPSTSTSTTTTATTTTPSSSCNVIANPGAGTAQAAINAAAAGQTVCLHGGNYTPSSSTAPVLNFSHGGSAGAPITVKSFPGERAVLRNTTNTALGTDLVAIPDSVNNVTLDSLTMIGPQTGFVYHVQGDNLVLRNSDISNNGGVGGDGIAGDTCVLLGSGSSGAAQNVSILNNRIHGCGRRTFISNGYGMNEDHCIYVANGRNIVIQNDFIYDCQAYAIQLYPQAMGTVIDHVTADAGITSRGGVVIGGESGFSLVSSNNEVRNSIFAGAVTYEFTTSSILRGISNLVHDNCVWPGTGGRDFDGSSGITYYANLHADPLFTDRAARDYTLRAGSSCTGKGAG